MRILEKNEKENPEMMHLMFSISCYPEKVKEELKERKKKDKNIDLFTVEMTVLELATVFSELIFERY